MKKIHTGEINSRINPIHLAILLALVAMPSHGWAEEMHQSAVQADILVTSSVADVLPEVQIQAGADRQVIASPTFNWYPGLIVKVNF